MMQFCRKIKTLGVAVSLFFFVTVFLPNQARANPLALVPVALIGASLALGAGAAGQYYAPAVYESGQLAVDNAGKVARQVYYGIKFINSVAGDYFYGKAVSLVANIGGFISYLQSKAAEIPTLWQQIQNAISSGFPAPPLTLPATGDVMTLSSAQVLGMYPTTLTSKYKFGILAATSPTCATEGSFQAGYFFWYNYYIRYVVDYGLAANGCTAPSHYVKIYIWSCTSTTDSQTVYPPGGFSPTKFDDTFSPSAGVAEDIDKLANDPASPPGFLTPSDISVPSVALDPAITTSPPAPITLEDIEQGGREIVADIDKKNSQQQGVIADNNPTDPIAQQNKAQAQADAAKSEAEKNKPSIPDISQTTRPAYTLPAVDFGARFQTFINVIRSSALFSVINNLTLTMGVGSSVLSLDFGTWGGLQSVDFADYNNAWNILRGVLFAVFVFVATRIVILKR